jgi:hypothetical protein
MTREQVRKHGQPLAIRRYVGAGPNRAWADTPTRAFVRYYDMRELIGSIEQGDQVAILLPDDVDGLLPIKASDKIVLGFEVVGGVATVTNSHVVGGQEFAIKNPKKRVLAGVLVALELHTTG